MSLASLLIHDITILTPLDVENRYGGTDRIWDGATETAARGWVSQRSTTEEIVGREAQVSDWVLFLHPEATITGLDRVRWGSITFEVAGEPLPAWTPRGQHHIEVPLRLVDG